MVTQNTPDGLDAVHVGHHDGHQHHVRAQYLRPGQRLPAGASLAHHFRLRSSLQQGNQALAKQGVAISRRQIKAVNIYELYTNGPLLIH